MLGSTWAGGRFQGVCGPWPRADPRSHAQPWRRFQALVLEGFNGVPSYLEPHPPMKSCRYRGLQNWVGLQSPPVGLPQAAQKSRA